MKMRRKDLLILGIFAVIVLYLGFVLAGVSWNSGAASTNYSALEDSTYYHNLSANITNFNNDINFAIDTETNINWTNSTGTYSVNKTSIEAWLSIINSSNGNLSINATYDNQTGFFVVPIQATNTTDSSFSGENFEFMINATNDFPNFTNINNSYNFTSLVPLFEYLNASDEEQHYPLNFTVTFNSTYCTHASWSGLDDNESCSLYDFGFNISSQGNVAALLNFTPNSTHVGTYYANISVSDAGAVYGCPHQFCDNTTYKVNKTTYYSTVVELNVFASLEIDASNCQNKVFQQDQAGTCNISIRTKGSADDIDLSTYSILRNYASGQSGVDNTSWFYPNISVASSNFEYNLTVNVTPSRTEVGNWTINFTAEDTTFSQTTTSQIYVYVNRTDNDVPSLASVSDVTTSANLATSIDLTSYDDDFLIPDQNESYGGFNETATFNVTVLNQSNLGQILTITGFDVNITNMPVSGTNRTTAQINFTPVPGDAGNYTINVTVNDSENAMAFVLFNLSILNNTAPSWNSGVNTTWFLMEDTEFYWNLSANVTDDDGDVLTFSYNNDTPFKNFGLNTTTGEVNFTPRDEDVGGHFVNITVSDGYLTSTETFTVNVTNINDDPVIHSMTSTNATPESGITNSSNVTGVEDNYTILNLFVEDDDFKVPSGQKSYYNESLSINVTLTLGPNAVLFNFTEIGPVGGFDNRSLYRAIFTPNKTDVGGYNVTINVTDESNSSTNWILQLTINELDHFPALSSLSNQTTAINRTLYYDLNVSDTEDGNDSTGVNSNFTFSYVNLSGNDIFSNYFNLTSGLLNITFNSSQAGQYHLNFTVNDSGGKEDYEDFWIFVYGLPTLVLPSEGDVFNLTENATIVLNFTVNHSILDNLTYFFKTDSISYDGSDYSYSNLSQRYNLSYYGNGTSLNWGFTPNFTDETYGLLKNLSLIVYPSTSNLENNTYLNQTFSFKFNVTHNNSEISFSGDISDKGPVSYDNSLTVNLSSYFTDVDYLDPFYDQSVSFTVSSNGSVINASVSSSWILTLSSSSAALELINVTGSDSSSNATSNNFLVQFVAPTASPESTSSSSSPSGGTTEIPVSLKLVLPDPVSAFQKDRIVLPITLRNTGKKTLTGIHLSGSVARNGTVANDVKIAFSQKDFGSLAEGEETNTTMTIDINTENTGLYEITVVGEVDNPVYSDWGKIYLTVKEGVDVEEKLVFTEEFIVSNPECLELRELVDEAKELSAQGKNTEAFAKADEALDACKNAIAQASRGRIGDVIENPLYRYLIIGSIVVLVAGVAFYSYKRMKLRRRQKSFIQQDIKNREFLNR